MSNRKNLVAWVRLDGHNRPIPGTMIYRQKKPFGKFVKMVDPSGDLCCGNVVSLLSSEKTIDTPDTQENLDSNPL